MSSPLAIAAVTAALKDLLNAGLSNHEDLSSIGSFSVTALPPDRVTTGQNEPNQLNLFLYQVTPNLGWRNADLPSRNTQGARLSNAPLAIDLHYLLTAYGSQDLKAEVLLGYAMQFLHETPVLTREQLRNLPSLFDKLSAADLADQVELIKITPVFLSTEDLSKMWTAMQARYRPTIAYMASVVLIQSTASARVAPPVLKRGQEDSGPVAFGSPSPTLTSVRPAASELLPAMRLGDDLLVTGTSLNAEGTITALFEHTKLTELTEDTKRKLVREITPAPASSPTQLAIHLPSIAENAQTMSDWAVGFYTLSLRVTRPSSPGWTTNEVPIALAPHITVNVSPPNPAPGDIDLTVTCTPRLRPEQEAQTSLIFGMQQITPQSITTPADKTKPTTLSFTVPAVIKGEYLVRLRVEGIDSLPITLTGSPPKLDFDPQQKVKVA